MSGVDKAKNKLDELGGKVKEAIGKVTGDTSTENEGKGDLVESTDSSSSRSCSASGSPVWMAVKIWA